jgi:hypothetical protein
MLEGFWKHRDSDMDCLTRMAVTTLAVGMIGSTAAYAQESVGNAQIVQRQVQGDLSGSIRVVKPGDKVFRDEVIKTSTDSSAKLNLVDLSSLSVGPSSSVKLDEFVYRGSGNSGSIVINATKGAFRFVTGSADHKSYEINTPTATIGVRGTVFDVLIRSGRTTAVLQKGAISVCRRLPGQKRTGECVQIDQPGWGTVVTATDITAAAPQSWSFADSVGVNFPTGSVDTVNGSPQ